MSFQAKESIWKTNGIAFKSRVYFARQNQLTTTISYSGKRTLKWVQGNNSSQKYNNVLEKKLLPLTNEAFLHDGYTFMQNNGYAHKSTFTKSCLDTKEIYTTIWHHQSSGINVIENDRRDIKFELIKVNRPITSPGHLYEEVERCFNKGPTQRIQYLYYSIPRCFNAVLNTRG